MNLATTYLAIVAFSLFPRMVKAYDWAGLTLLEDLEPVLFDPIEEMTSLSSMLRRHQEMVENAFSFRGGGGVPQMLFEPSPFVRLSLPQQQQSYSIQVNNNPDQFQVSVQLPSGLSPEDLKVDLDERDRLLTIGGQHEFTSEETGYRSVSQFSRSFALDPFVEVDKLCASIDDGSVLVVTAPKNIQKLQHSVRSIPVIQNTDNNVEEVQPAVQQQQQEQEEELTVPISRSSSEESRDDEDEVEEVEDAGASDSFDPFHIKERVQKTLFQKKENDDSTPPNAHLQESVSGFKTSELRRRR